MVISWRAMVFMPICGGASRRRPPRPSARSRSKPTSCRPSARKGICVSPSSIPTRRPLLPIFAACAAAGLLAGTSWPLVPLALERQGVDKALIGVIAAAWGVGMLLTAPRIPHLAARFGTVPLMVVAVVIGAAVSVGYTLISNPYAWFAL